MRVRVVWVASVQRWRNLTRQTLNADHNTFHGEVRGDPLDGVGVGVGVGDGT
jgi:hypothetical protein